MSALPGITPSGVEALIPARVPQEGRRHARSRPRILSILLHEGVIVFVISYAFYMVLGWRIVHQQHLVVFDATARLAHAYFVWWNAPPKLASIGFVWAPLSTLVLLPFTLIKPLATSLMALPASSGRFFPAASRL